VRDFSVKDLSQFKEQLNSGNYAKDTPVFLSASHGSVVTNKNGFKEMIIDAGGYDICADGLLGTLRSAVPQSSILLETCKAGQCRLQGWSGIGTSCSSQQQSLTKNTFPDRSIDAGEIDGDSYPVADQMVALWCDSINQCAAWKDFDKNSDGKLSGDEINQFLIKKFKKDYPSTQTRKHTGGMKTFKTLEEAQASADQCRKEGSQFHCTEITENFKLSFSVKKPDGSWKSVLPATNIVPAGLKPWDISGAIPESLSPEKLKFSEDLQTLLNGHWPKVKEEKESQKETVRLLKDYIGVDKINEMKVSDSGKELTFKDDNNEEQTLRLDKFSPQPEEPVFSCECFSNKEVPILNNIKTLQEVFFDDKFEIPCKGKRPNSER